MAEENKKVKGLERYIAKWAGTKDALNQTFNNFYPVRASTVEEIVACFHLRYQVFCTEMNFEETNPYALEADAFDARSEHILIKDRATGEISGCFRLIQGEGSHGNPLAMETHAKNNAIDHDRLALIKASGDGYCEVSRLTVSKKFRAVAGNKSDAGNTENQIAAVLYLYLCMLACAQQTKNKYLLALVEPRMYLTLLQMDVPIQTMGTAVQYRGNRIPVVVNIEELKSRKIISQSAMFKSILSKLKPQFRLPAKIKPSSTKKL